MNKSPRISYNVMIAEEIVCFVNDEEVNRQYRSFERDFDVEQWLTGWQAESLARDVVEERWNSGVDGNPEACTVKIVLAGHAVEIQIVPHYKAYAVVSEVSAVTISGEEK